MTQYGSSYFVELALRGRPLLTVPADLPLVLATPWYPPEVVKAGSVRPGEFVGVRHGGPWPSEPARLPILAPRRRTGSEKAIQLPTRMSTDLAFLLGAYASEGHTTRSNWSVILTNSVMAVLEKAREAWRRVFALEARITRQPGRCTGLVVSSKRLVEFMELIGCGSRASNKQVPACVINSTREHVLAFLQGFALDAYTTTACSSARWAICLESKAAIDQLQNLMTRLGIVTAQIPKYNKVTEKTYFELYAAGRSAREVCEMVPFLEPDKAQRAQLLLDREYGTNAADVVPGIDGRSLYNLMPRGKPGRNGRGTGRQAFTFLCDSRTSHVSRHSIERLHELGVPLPLWLVEVLEQRVHFIPVISRSLVPGGWSDRTEARPSRQA